MEKATHPSTIKILAVVEATTVNAVAKNMLEFHRSASDIKQRYPGSVTIETSLVTFDRPKGPAKSPNEFVTTARELGIKVDIIPERFRFDARVMPALRKIVERNAPDIVLTHQVKSHLLMKLSRLWRQYPWIAFHHGYTTTNRKMRAYNHFNRWSLPTADRVITVCEAFARELAVAGVSRERIHVQHNSIRPDQAASAEEVEALKTRLGVAPAESIVVTVGRLSREKAHIDLLAAFKHLREINPEIESRLLIVGDGPERERLEAAAGSLGLSQLVVFTGELSDVQPYYAAAHLLVLPSHSEGSPYVLLEAMAAKVPIVATAVGGVPEMVENEESALLVPAHDPRALAAAIARVLTDPELARKLTANASTLVATRYSPEAYLRSLLEIYREVISTSTKRNTQAT
ncbi:MAG: glycosyltransferase family 4 protein [Acidobacteriota bacterium]|nr:glycosyltransferase family 4 protein [Acidobacteriota bacterium]